jgi:hypothetical protein
MNNNVTTFIELGENQKVNIKLLTNPLEKFTEFDIAARY